MGKIVIASTGEWEVVMIGTNQVICFNTLMITAINQVTDVYFNKAL